MTRDAILAHLKGIFTPVITPFDRWGGLDTKCFRQNLRREIESGVSGVVVAGSTGEAPYLTERGRLRLVEVARAVIRPPLLLIAGTGLESTHSTLHLSQEAVRRGADAVLVLPPNFFRAQMDAAALIAHFRTLADGLRAPVILYNIPRATGIHMAAEVIVALARHPNIIGLKDSSGDLKYLRAIRARVNPRFRVLVGWPPVLLQSLRAGATGGVLGEAAFAPEICLGLYDAFVRGRFSLARDLQKRLTLLIQKTTIPFGVAGMKCAYELCGGAAGPPRAPLLPLRPSDRRAIAAALDEARAGLTF